MAWLYGSSARVNAPGRSAADRASDCAGMMSLPFMVPMVTPACTMRSVRAAVS